MTRSKVGDIPPPLPDPALYIWVETKERSYWRRKRGSLKPAVLNPTMTESGQRMKITSPAAKRMLSALKLYIEDLDKGRINIKIGARLGKELKENGKVDFSSFVGFDFQPREPIDTLLKAQYEIEKQGKVVRIRIPIKGKWTVVKKNQLVTSYRFIGVLLYGDPLFASNGLHTRDVVSDEYTIDEVEGECVLELALPKSGVLWMLCLRVECMEGNEPGHHPRHRGMKVVAVG